MSPDAGRGTVGSLEREVTLKVSPHNFSQSRPFPIGPGWYPRAIEALGISPPTADVILAPLPMRGGMRVVAYNRSDVPASVTFRMP